MTSQSLGTGEPLLITLLWQDLARVTSKAAAEAKNYIRIACFPVPIPCCWRNIMKVRKEVDLQRDRMVISKP